MNPFDRRLYSQNIVDRIKRTIFENPYIPVTPYPRQLWPIFEVTQDIKNNEAHTILVGGGAFGGKTFLGTILSGQYLEVPNYSCLVTRLNYGELTGQDSIWENAVNWFCEDEERLSSLGVDPCKSHDGKSRIKSPYGAKIWFKAFSEERKKQKVKSEGYDRIINDEASELWRKVLQFLYRSLRNAKDAFIPLSFINLSNPSENADTNEYLCAMYVDGTYSYYWMDWRHNIHIVPEVYKKQLDKLDFIDQKYQRDADWHYSPAKGDLFKEQDLQDVIINSVPSDRRIIRSVRGVDMAITTSGDRTAFLKWLRDERGHGYITDLVVKQTKYPEYVLLDLVELDNPNRELGVYDTEYIFEYEIGDAAVHQERFIRSILKEHIKAGLLINFTHHSNNKFTRARPMAHAIKNLNVSILKDSKDGNGWNKLLIDEYKDFGPDPKEYEYDDIVDAGSIGYNRIFKGLGTDKYATSNQKFIGAQAKGRFKPRPRGFRR